MSAAWMKDPHSSAWPHQIFDADLFQPFALDHFCAAVAADSQFRVLTCNILVTCKPFRIFYREICSK
jgi:hypothetical protein